MKGSKWTLRIVCAASTVLILTATAVAQEGDVGRVHDPCVIKDGDAFYLFSTGGKLPMRRSRDLIRWEFIGETLPEIPDWAQQLVPAAEGLWAPDISYFNDRFHLYYSVSSFGSNRSCIGLATNRTLDSTAPDYKWEDQGLVVRSQPERDDFNAIDPHVVLDEQGRPWMSFGSFWSGIKLVRLNAQTGKPDGDLIHIAGRHGGAIEAPFIFRHANWFYLFVSFDKCCQGVDSTYKVMVGRSERVEGPYRDFAGKELVEGGGSLVLAGYDHIRGPGHNAVLSENGQDYLVHHYYDARTRGRPTLQIRPLMWDENDWPLAGEPIERTLAEGNQTPTVTGEWKYSVNFGEGKTITLLPNGKIEGAQGDATWRLVESMLRLSWPESDGPDGVRVEQCYLTPGGNAFVGRNRQGDVIRVVRSP